MYSLLYIYIKSHLYKDNFCILTDLFFFVFPYYVDIVSYVLDDSSRFIFIFY
jgi:hypothetical protein